MDGDTFVFGPIETDPWWRKLLWFIFMDLGGHAWYKHRLGDPCIIVTKAAVWWGDLNRTLTHETIHHVVAELEGLETSQLLDRTSAA